MQSPIAVQELSDKFILTYPVFCTQTALLSYQQLVSDSWFIFTDVFVGDAVLSVPPSFSSNNYSTLQFVVNSTTLLSVAGDIRALIGGMDFFGALPGVFGRGVYINGAQSNYTMTGNTGSLALPNVPTTIALDNIYGAPRLWPSFNNVSMPPDVGIVHRWKMTIGLDLVVYK